jgi:MFS family permease
MSTAPSPFPTLPDTSALGFAPAEGLPRAQRIGPILLAPGVARSQVAVFLGVAACLGLLFGFINVAQPLLLDQLGIPADHQGRVTGNLAFIDQFGFMLFISSAGTLADTLGRRGTLIVALIGMLLANLLFPFAGSIAVLYGLRFGFGLARTAHTAGGTALIMDYPDNASRGKFLSLVMLNSALSGAVLIGGVGARLPGWFAAAGFTMQGATRLAFAVVGLFGAVGLWLAAFRLAREARRTAPGHTPWQLQIASFRGFSERFRSRPRYRFIMLMALAIRSDYIIVDAFVSLWILRDGVASGMSRSAALATAGLAYSMLRIMQLVGPVLLGIVADRVERTRLLAGMLVLSALSFAAVLLVGNATHWEMFAVVGLIGFFESGTIVVAQSVLGEEAPAELRGISMSVFALLGTLGVLLSTSVGGQLFDRVGPAAPFLFVGALNLVFAIWAITMARETRHSAGVIA